MCNSHAVYGKKEKAPVNKALETRVIIIITLLANRFYQAGLLLVSVIVALQGPATYFFSKASIIGTYIYYVYSTRLR